MMADYEVGYGKPPLSGRFKPGASGNPRGRPKRAANPWAETIQNLLDQPVKYRVAGKAMRATYLELTIQALVDRAAKGEVAAAELVLRIAEHAEQLGDIGVMKLLIENWAPAYPGQTAEQKARLARDAQAAVCREGTQLNLYRLSEKD
jgi:hypothetical protein